jgi:hypothetical protein
VRALRGAIMAVLLPVVAMAATPEEQPALSTEVREGGIGTTIVGEQDAAVGLYITPWKEESASDLDRPPSLFDAPAQPIDAYGFSRRVRYFDAARAHRAERLQRND